MYVEKSGTRDWGTQRCNAAGFPGLWRGWAVGGFRMADDPGAASIMEPGAFAGNYRLDCAPVPGKLCPVTSPAPSARDWGHPHLWFG